MLSEVEGLYNHGQGRHVGIISSFKKKTVVVMRDCELMLAFPVCVRVWGLVKSPCHV